MRAECALRVPEESTDEGEQQHGWLADRDRTAEKHELHQQDARVMDAGERRQELLQDECCEQEQDRDDGISDQGGSGFGGQDYEYRTKIREVHRGPDESFGIQCAFFDGNNGPKKDVGLEDSSAASGEHALAGADRGVG